MILLTADKVRDFQTCDLLYKYRHGDEVFEPIYQREILLEKFEIEIKKIMSFFFYKKQGGSVPSYNALLSRWQRNWYKDEETPKDIALSVNTPHLVNKTNLTTRAAQVLLHFYNDFADQVNQPIMIDESVSVSVSNETRINATYDLALRDQKTNKLLIIKWITKGKGAWSGTIDYGIDFAMLDYLFREKSSLASELTPIYALYEIGAKNNKLNVFNLSETHKKSLSFWIDKIENTETFVPRRGLTVACKTCNFDKPCSKFDEYEGHDVG